MIALIPARGGSKGLPRKNILPLHGKPLIAYTIEAALAAKHISEVMVSTDSEEIANVAKKYGAQVPFMRPPELATDTALAIDNYVHFLKTIGEMGYNNQELTVLLPTAPLRDATDIDASIEIFRDRKADSVISFYEAPHPVQWYKYIDDKGVLRNLNPESEKLANRQEERKSYLPNGAIYVFRSEILVNQRAYYTDKTFPYIMPAKKSVDIDTSFDFELAEFLLSKNRETK